MVRPSLPSLLDLCSIRVAYLMWTRHEVIEACRSLDDWNNLKDVVFAEVQSISLPEKLKSLVLKILKPVGWHLRIFVSLLLSKTQPVNSVDWLTEDMLTQCLILNGDGLINHRKTAEKILSSRMLPDVFAFRLACVNFLQVEVLKLWPRVMLYFLNKMMLESEKPHVINDMFSFPKLFGTENKQVSPYHPYFNEIRETDSVSYTTEPREVLFWISHCLSKEHSMQATPFFEKEEVKYDFSLKSEFLHAEDWKRFILKAAVSSGNALDFIRNRTPVSLKPLFDDDSFSAVAFISDVLGEDRRNMELNF
ncbi:hypothetical protein AVEN_245569-2 [Araneus ventricosus]|uniref:Uncharacterized protein n=1 Tax=Araneus ventricosus TaxID=182803 RepID=A0A4Y2QE93_ARAVE|nr:hypothetical protein AVEN_245569-2 [Araneus ventricosus]